MVHFVAVVGRAGDLRVHREAMRLTPPGSGPVDLPHVTDPVLTNLPALAEVAGGTLGLMISDPAKADFLRRWCEREGHTCDVHVLPPHDTEGSERMPPPTLEEVWRRYDAVEARLSGPLSERMLDLAGLQRGMHVLDLATGRGEPALRAASRVGSEGSVLGIDLSAEMLRMTKEAADREGITNLELRVGDAESVKDIPQHHFHAATVRWGLMYMGAPIAALTTIHRSLVREGVLVAALWVEPEQASFFTLPRRLLERYRPVPALDSEAPGPFRYAELPRVVTDFSQAGFTIDHVEDIEVPVFEADSGREIVAWVRAVGSGMRQLLNEMPENAQRAWEQDLITEMERTRSDGLMRLSGVTRIVRARPI